MNFKGVLYYLGLFCFPISFLSLLNILYSSYFDHFLNLDSYTITLFISLSIGTIFFFSGNKSIKKIDFLEQIFLIILVYFVTALLISIPYYLSNYQIPFIDAVFESFSGISGTGFSIFENIKYLDPTLILWRSSSQWLGGLYFLIFLVLFFSNSQFNYKLNNLVFSNSKSLNPETHIKSVSLQIFFLYFSLSALIFICFSGSGIRLFNSLNLTMTIVSAGGFLPTNSLSQIIKTNAQELFLFISLLLPILNIYFFYNIFLKKNVIRIHYEDFWIVLSVLIFSVILLLSTSSSSLISVLISVTSSLSTSGITINQNVENFSLYLLFLTIIGGSIISNTSGIKLLRIYILLKSTFIDIFKLVKPNNIINQYILFSENKLNNEITKLSFLVFISFFVSLFFLSGLLLIDNLEFETAFKLSILTLTNTVNSELYAIAPINFADLLTSSKLSIIMFMIIGKIELVSFLLIIKKIFFKN